ncbi:MAG: YfhO family protein [Clostridiaceae bacterium]|nr:YfhO family protein [Clostridiaceae bacterium]
MSANPDANSFEEGMARYIAENDEVNTSLKKLKTSNSQYNFLAFLIPLLILALAYATRTIFPFGDRQILTVDLFHQYAPFMATLRRTILSGESLFFTFSGGLGMNFYSLIAYYLASPLNILLLIFPESFLSEAVFVLTLIKVGLAGMAFHLFLKETFQRKGAFSVIFGTMYALSAYVMAYSWNIMWLDALILLPLVLWALTRLIKQGKFILYVVFLLLLLISNYYVAFFACIFIALYFPILMVQHTEGWKAGSRAKVIVKIIAATAIAVALSAVLLLPVLKSLQYTSASGDKFPQSIEFAANPLAYLAQHFMLLQPTIRSGYPNLYSGVSIILLVPIFFMSGRIRLREKLMHAFLLLFLLLSFDLNILNFLWHGKHFPNQLPYRNSFVYIFLVLTMAYAALRSLRDLKSKDVVLLAVPLLLAVPVSVLLLDDLAGSVATQWVTIAFLVLYTLIFASLGRSVTGEKNILIGSSASSKRSTLSIVLILIMIFELITHSIVSVHFVDTNEYYGLRDGYAAGDKPAAIRAALVDIENNYQDGPFYRVELNKQKSSNDPALYGYNGLSMFASTSAKAPVKFFDNIGYYSNGINSYKYTGSTLFLDSLFGIEFLLARDPISYDEVLREKVLDNGEVQVYQNPYTLPLGFAANSSVLTYSSMAGNVFQNQNRLAQHINSDLKNIFTELKVSNLDAPPEASSASGNSRFNFYKTYPDDSYTLHLNAEIEESATYYLYFDNKRNDMDDAKLTDQSGRVISLNRSGLTELGLLGVGEVNLELTFSASAAASGEVELRLARLDEAELKKFCLAGNRGGLKLSSFRNDYFYGHFESPDNGVLLLSIPYDPGWTVWVDGEIQEVRKVDQALMAIPVSAGEHRITMLFRPEGLSEGLLISVVALGVFILAIAASAFLKKRREQAAAGEIIVSDSFLSEPDEEENQGFDQVDLDDSSLSTNLSDERELVFEEILEENAEQAVEREINRTSDKMKHHYMRSYLHLDVTDESVDVSDSDVTDEFAATNDEPTEDSLGDL